MPWIQSNSAKVLPYSHLQFRICRIDLLCSPACYGWKLKECSLLDIPKVSYDTALTSETITPTDFFHYIHVLLDSKLTMKKQQDYMHLFLQFAATTASLVARELAQILQLDWILPSYLDSYCHFVLASLSQSTIAPLREFRMWQQGLWSHSIHMTTSHQLSVCFIGCH